MNLVLRGFSQDVDLYNPEQSENYLVFQETQSGTLFRLPVPEETIARLTQIVQGDQEGAEVPVEVQSEEEPEEAQPPPPVPPPVAPRRIPRPQLREAEVKPL